MLVLQRGPEEEIVIGESITVRVLGVAPDEVRLGISAPPNVPIDRSEVRAQKMARLAADRKSANKRGEHG